MPEIVHCPKCQAAVSVGTDQAGERVQCPSCLKQFLAPSTLSRAGASKEDEDWLSLEEPAAQKSNALYTSPKKIELEPHDSDDIFGSDESGATEDVDEVEEFVESDASDDPFNADLFGQSDTSGSPNLESDTDDLFGDLPAVDGAPAPNQTAGAGKAQSLDPEQEFRVKCPICSSVMYAKAKQTGKTIKCSDCYTEIKVPAAPKKPTKPQPNEEAETFTFSDSGGDRPADPFQRSADELMREAEKDPEEDKFTPAFDAPSTIGWFKSVFGIFLDPGVIIHFVGLSILLALPAAVTFAYPVFAIGAAPLAMLGITLSVACGFAIMFGVSNEHERIEDWPTADPTGWFESIGLVIASTAIAVGPAYVLATLLAAPMVLTIGLVMLSVYVAFPFILLSMLDMQSITTPFSPDVSKSITRCQEDWGAFYFSSGALFCGLMAYFLMCSYTPTSVAIGVVLSIAVIFMYFAMLGRLALAIGEVVDLTALDQEDSAEDDGS